MTTLNKRKNIISTAVLLLVTTIIVFISILGSLNIIEQKQRITSLETRIIEMQKVEKITAENQETMLRQMEYLNRITQERLDLEKKRERSVSNLQSRGFSRYTDISANRDLTAEDMNKIIDTWDNHVKGGTRFKGHGNAFILASKKSGLNPIIILSHAASESQWGNSQIAKEKNNFFGINCIDSNPDKGYVMGDGIDDGIINGAVWIQKNFYNNGHTTLQSMLDANYASDTGWARVIVSIANSSLRILQA